MCRAKLVIKRHNSSFRLSKYVLGKPRNYSSSLESEDLGF